MVVEDDAFVALTHASGARSHVWLSAVAAQGGPRFRVLGSSGAWVKHGMDVQEAALKDGARPRGREDWGREPESQWGRLGTDEDAAATETMAGDYGRFYRGVVQAMREGAPPPVDPSDAAHVLELLEHARVSAAEHRVVAVREMGGAHASAGAP